MDGPPPLLRLSGPYDNHPNARTVSEIRERLQIARDHPSITDAQRIEIDGELYDIKFAGPNNLILPPPILLHVEAMPLVEVKEKPGKQRGGRKTLRMRSHKRSHMRGHKRSYRKKTHRNRK